MTIEQTIEQAKRHHLAGELHLAAPLYRQVLDTQPDHSKALFFSGMLAAQQGRHQNAADLIAAAIAVDPSVAAYHLSLGQSLLALNRFDEAIAAYCRAVAIQPNLSEAFFGIGLAHQSQKQLDDAILAYQQAIVLKPDYVEAHNNLGHAHQHLGDLEKAIECFRRAITLRPDYVASHNNLAVALLAQRQFDRAIPVLHRALKLQPDFAQGWYNLGNALTAIGQFDQAIIAQRRAIALQPNYAEAHCNLGNALQAVNDLQTAAEAYRQALKIRPDFVDALCNLASVLRRIGDFDQAMIVYHKALEIRPNFSAAHCNLGNVYKDTGNLDAAIAAFRRALECDPTDAISHSNLIYTLSYHSDYDAEKILREHLQFNAAHAAAFEMTQHDNDSFPHRRLRIGYVAPHFRDHCQSLFTIPLLSQHNHEQFEIFCYSSAVRPDSLTDRIAGHADVFRNVSTSTDAELTKIIRDDRIDILIDLTMHMSDGRPLLFARKPAPLQIAWLAYPGTTGISAIDYRISDPHLDPPDENENFYSEKTIRLPETFWCYDPLSIEPIQSELAAAANGRITFGCLNNFCKVTSPTIDLWAKTLAVVENSHMLILCPAGQHRQRLLDQFEQRDISPQRIEFADFQPRRNYLRLYHRIDIGLDTIPYNGHTTSLDSFWMGVPVVTRIGRTVVGRAGLSQLSNLNLRELAAETDQQFVQIAASLANDLPRLSELRQTLRQRMERSPLMNAQRFCSHIESIYRQAWEHRCAANRF